MAVMHLFHVLFDLDDVLLGELDRKEMRLPLGAAVCAIWAGVSSSVRTVWWNWSGLILTGVISTILVSDIMEIQAVLALRRSRFLITAHWIQRPWIRGAVAIALFLLLFGAPILFLQPPLPPLSGVIGVWIAIGVLRLFVDHLLDRIHLLNFFQLIQEEGLTLNLLLNFILYIYDSLRDVVWRNWIRGVDKAIGIWITSFDRWYVWNSRFIHLRLLRWLLSYTRFSILSEPPVSHEVFVPSFLGVNRWLLDLLNRLLVHYGVALVSIAVRISLLLFLIVTVLRVWPIIKVWLLNFNFRGWQTPRLLLWLFVAVSTLPLRLSTLMRDVRILSVTWVRSSWIRDMV